MLRKIISLVLDDCDFLWQERLNMTKGDNKIIILPLDRPYNTLITARRVTNPLPVSAGMLWVV